MTDFVMTPELITQINAATTVAEIEAIAATFSTDGPPELRCQ
jgi:hypothetical protein